MLIFVFPSVPCHHQDDSWSLSRLFQLPVNLPSPTPAPTNFILAFYFGIGVTNKILSTEYSFIEFQRLLMLAKLVECIKSFKSRVLGICKLERLYHQRASINPNFPILKNYLKLQQCVWLLFVLCACILGYSEPLEDINIER